eukprot:g81869.t1
MYTCWSRSKTNHPIQKRADSQVHRSKTNHSPVPPHAPKTRLTPSKRAPASVRTDSNHSFSREIFSRKICGSNAPDREKVPAVIKRYQLLRQSATSVQTGGQRTFSRIPLNVKSKTRHSSRVESRIAIV